MKTNNTNTQNIESAVAEEVALLSETFKSDMKTSVLVVSLMANLFVLTAWLVLQTTSSYDAEIITALMSR
ncbi:hypothetical protein JNJ66_04865 [Candidatus Saccharibacteria bacterium]|nr:hypothetical protein [Candidatus Saccharibacteria bacterium]